MITSHERNIGNNHPNIYGGSNMKHSRIIALTLAFTLFAIPAIGANGNPGRPGLTGVGQSTPHGPVLSPSAEQTAQEIGILRQVERLRTLAAGCHQAKCMTVEELALHQQITEAIVEASLDVNTVLSEIEDERARVMEVRQLLASRRDHKIGLLSMANIITGTGSGIVGTAMQFSTRTAIPGDAVGVAGGVVGVFFSILGLRAHGGTGSAGGAPSMLAPLIGPAQNRQSLYPHDIWAYLNAPAPSNSGVQVSRRQSLIDEWVRTKKIGLPGAPGSEKEIGLLTSKISEHKPMSVHLLRDRSIMLLDLGARVSMMSRDLSNLLNAIAIIPDS